MVPIISNWITLSVLSAITFAFGDLVVVKSSIEHIGVTVMFIMYTIVVGIINFLYILYNYSTYQNHIYSLTFNQWSLILLMSLFYIIAYLSHFMGLQIAPNPGYSNALVMFHVAILTILSYLLYNKPLNLYGIIGIVFMMIGGYMISVYSN